MRQNSELRRYMKAITKQSAERLDRHLSHDELIAYWQSETTAPEREAAQTHLLHCDRCLALFRDVNDFFEPRREDETGMNEFEAHRAWRDLRRRLHNAEVITAPQAQSSTGRPRFNPRLASAITAGLLIAVASLGLWALRLRRENQQLAAQVQAMRQESEARVAQAEISVRQQTDRERGLVKSLEAQLAESKQPQINAPTYGLMPINLTQRTGEKITPTVIAPPPGVRSFALTLTMENPEPGANYTLEIFDSRNQVVWRKEGLRPDENHNFTIILPHDFLKPGEYRLRLFKRGAPRSKPDAEYLTTVDPWLYGPSPR